MDTRFLESFLNVVECGSMAQAARRLNLTPAGVAQRLKALEAELGVRLVVRAGRNVMPTEAGIAIIERARRLLSDTRDLAAIASDQSLAGELRIGAVPTATTGLLPDMMTVLRDAHPRIDIRIVPGGSADLYSRVVEGELDAAVIVQPYFALPKTCGWQLLREERLIVLAPGAMAGADAHTVLSTEPFIRYDQGSWGGRIVDAYLRKAGIRTRERFELVTLDAIAVLVDRGLGVSLVPEWSPPWPEGLSLAKLPLPGEVPARCMGLLWGLASPRTRLVKALVALLRQRGNHDAGAECGLSTLEPPSMRQSRRPA